MSDSSLIEEIKKIATILDTQWKVAGKNGASELFGLYPSSLRICIRKLGIRKPQVCIFLFQQTKPLTGIQFESLNPHKILKDDLLEIKFKLDNRLKSKIRKLVKVIWVRGHIIGAHFIETKLYEEELQSYLQI
jgi:hypothetical protein